MEELTLTLRKTKDTKNKVVYGTEEAAPSRASTQTGTVRSTRHRPRSRCSYPRSKTRQPPGMGDRAETARRRQSRSRLVFDLAVTWMQGYHDVGEQLSPRVVQVMAVHRERPFTTQEILGQVAAAGILDFDPKSTLFPTSGTASHCAADTRSASLLLSAWLPRTGRGSGEVPAGSS